MPDTAFEKYVTVKANTKFVVGWGFVIAATVFAHDRSLVVALVGVYLLVEAAIYNRGMAIAFGLEEEFSKLKLRLEQIEQQLRKVR